MSTGKGAKWGIGRSSFNKLPYSTVLLPIVALSGCAVESAPMPPDGHVFLTVVVQQNSGSAVPGCLVKLEPSFGEPATVTASSGTSDQSGSVELVQSHGLYEMLTQCPGEMPTGPVLVDLEGTGLTYATLTTGSADQ